MTKLFILVAAMCTLSTACKKADPIVPDVDPTPPPAITLTPSQSVALPKNGTLAVKLNGYEQGAIQWQLSTNKIQWDNIPSETAETLRYTLSSPAWFRAEIRIDGRDPFYTEPLQANTRHYLPDPRNSKGDRRSLNAGRAYMEPYNADSDIEKDNSRESGDLSKWNSTAQRAVWHLYHPEQGMYELNFGWSLTNKQTRNFRITCSATNIEGEFKSTSGTFSYTGTSQRDTTPALTVDIPAPGYYRYELQMTGTAAGSLTVHDLVFAAITTPSKTAPTQAPHTPDYLSSPSVHLSFHTTAPTTNEYDWIYSEILVPSGRSAVNTYWMSLGFFQGYMGIQANSATERRVLFSCWDAGDTDIDPGTRQDLLVSFVHKGPNVTGGRFGSEGTGGQTYISGINVWADDRPVKFLMNVRQDGYTYDAALGKNIVNVLVSAWYQAFDEWVYIATWRQPVLSDSQTEKYFSGFYSFIETFWHSNGQQVRKGYYYNSFGREAASGKWIHFNKVGFTNTDGAPGQRVDFEQGVAPEAPDKFYMLSGGYGATKKTGNEVALQTNFALDISPFVQDVDEAAAQGQ